MDLNTLLAGSAAGATMGAIFLGGARYMIRAELSTFKTSFMQELNGTYVRSGEYKIVQKLREEQFRNLDEKLESSGID